jgi:putative ABC transport system ATP-binding protein
MDDEVALQNQVRLEGVSKSYGGTLVLDNVDFCAQRGEFIVVIGRSGSGKSTLLNLIGGLDEPDSGSVAYGGRRLDRMDESERAGFRRTQVGFVFQFFNLVPTLTVAENIELPLALNKLTPTAVSARIAT